MEITVVSMPSFIPGAHFYKVTTKVRECLREVDAKPFAYTKEQLVRRLAFFLLISTLLIVHRLLELLVRLLSLNNSTIHKSLRKKKI